MNNNWRCVLLGVVLPLLIFGLLTYQVWGKPGGILGDETILWTIQATANPQLDAIAKTLTKFSSTVLPLAIVTVLVLLKQSSWRSLAYWLITILGSIVIKTTGKSLIQLNVGRGHPL
ncbi:MAG: hypothetical protein F6K14_29755 [Symploca sp. SIO2C1]|nr:hypothetical protein [Symploca sp. SIO2C1]